MTDAGSDDRPQTRAQTPAQWAVRWHGIACAALLLLAVPGFHLVWHVALGHDEPVLRTRSQVPMPEPTFAAIADGTWMTGAERHLQEDSPIVWWLRGNWNELLLRCGIVLDQRVHLGRDRWMFHTATLKDRTRQFDSGGEGRRRFFAEVRDLVRAAGAELIVSLVPDKSRVYPELAFADGRLLPGKAPIYGRALQELRDLGIHAPDQAAAFAAARAALPQQQLFFARDTHWMPQGALVAGQTLAALIESLPVAQGLVPRRPAELGAETQVTSLSDLVGLLGLLTCELPHPTDPNRTRTHPLSLFGTELLEQRSYYPVVLRTETGRVNPLVDDPTTDILLLGTSFSEANGAGALALALGRPVRAVIDYGASGVAPLRKVADELRQGTKAKLVIWEIVERGLFEQDWGKITL